MADAALRLTAAMESGGYSFAVIGGLAVIIRGYDRFTRDIDAVVWDADERLEHLIQHLSKHGLTLRESDGLSFARRYRVILLQTPREYQVDVSMGLVPFEREVIDRSSLEKLGESVQIPVANAEDLIIMKLIASRDRDIDDVRRLLELYPDVEHGRIRRIVSEYAEVLDQPEIVSQMSQLLK
ncbi:MAG: nucleotidyl transferase AbiEii/AbiGii toxin family protein [Fimbriimonadales bacterium]